VRDRLTELLPLLLVGVVLLALHLLRGGAVALPFAPGESPTPTPSIEVAAARQARTPRPSLNSQPGAGGGGPGVCAASQPRFMRGMKRLREALGELMGEPTECERPVGADGDTHQATTTGLAYYRKSLNIVVFTTGWDHWSMVDRGLVHWSGHDVDPPPEAAVLSR
jgi:hypothetical protein